MAFRNFYLIESEKLAESKFNFSHLDSLETFEEKIKYCKENLVQIGKGSSRLVFDLSKNSVLKLAWNEKGLGQNLMEQSDQIHKLFGDMVPALKKKCQGDKIYWIVMEKAKPVDEETFEKISKIPFKTFQKAMTEMKLVNYKEKKDVSEETKELLKTSHFLDLVQDLTFSLGLLVGDVIKTSSWGTIGNRLVILDTGLQKDFFNTFYKKHRK
jgi:hypothetical protein